MSGGKLATQHAKQLEAERREAALARLRQEVAGRAEREADREAARLVRKRQLREERAAVSKAAAHISAK